MSHAKKKVLGGISTEVPYEKLAECKIGEEDPSGGDANVNKPEKDSPPEEEVIYVPDDGEDEDLDSVLLAMDQQDLWPRGTRVAFNI